MCDLSRKAPPDLKAVSLTGFGFFFLPKKALLKKCRELFAKERNYPSTTKLHDKARKQVRNLYITCTEYTKRSL